MHRDGCVVVVFFFFQAEDGIRDYKVTGVQTCALPILIVIRVGELSGGGPLPFGVAGALADERFGGKPAPHGFRLVSFDDKRSEERRVGKEGRSRWSPDH